MDTLAVRYLLVVEYVPYHKYTTPNAYNLFILNLNEGIYISLSNYYYLAGPILTHDWWRVAGTVNSCRMDMRGGVG